MKIGQTADKIMETRQDKTREFWIELYINYFNYKSDWDGFWKLVEETA